MTTRMMMNIVVVMMEEEGEEEKKTYPDSLQEWRIPWFSSQQYQVEVLHREEQKTTLVVLFPRKSENEVPGWGNDIHRLSDHRTGS